MKKNYIFALITVLIWASMATMVKVLLADIPNLQALVALVLIIGGILLQSLCERKNAKN